MRKLASAVIALLVLAGCSEERDTPAAATSTPAASTQQEAREAGTAIRDAGREVGEAASSAAGDIRDAAGPVAERAKAAGAEALDATRNGLNDLAKAAACQTAKGVDDTAGIAANC